jgi:NADPH-dependent 2,4-dienoyl-CoA reductase/sulfur reductase-like enzyme
LERRDLFKLAGVSIAAATLSGCTLSTASMETSKQPLKAKSNGKRVVVIGAGFGGLCIAKQLRQKEKSLEVIVVDKKDMFMSCPYSNAYLGGLDNVSLESLMHDFYGASQIHGYDFIQAEVTAIDASNKTVITTSGSLTYDILVLSPGIAYDYEKQFPTWNKAKIADVSKACPAALITGNEHLALKRQLVTMGDGDVVIIPPASGKYRCPPAPYERVSMIAHHMRQEGILGKVIVLDTIGATFGKTPAFKESWESVYGGRIEHIENTKIMDINPTKKTITYKEFKDANDQVGVDKTIPYAVCNFMPINKASAVIAMAAIKTNTAGFAIMEGSSFRSISNKTIYVIGDCVAHNIPATAHTAIWSAKRAASEIVAQLGGVAFNSKSDLPAKDANIGYSLVNGNPHEAIMVSHDFEINPSNGNLNSKGAIPRPKDGYGFYRSKGLGEKTNAWFNEIKKELFL